QPRDRGPGQRRRPASAQEPEGEPLMGQKINPNGFRLGITTDHKSKWFADSTKPGQRYKDYVLEDVKIRRMMSTGLERAGISKVKVVGTSYLVRVHTHAAHQDIVIERPGAEVDLIRIQNDTLNGKEIHQKIIEVKNHELDAQLVTELVAEVLASRV